ncbi:ankyrin repeat domain-containing protein [Kitasatospora sp. NBC_01287]|uniref:ankyrin repeat domain-containing protein n=1 Tax=Kitasatospora sp. NBC_01287 TaxID=2903573 RepID=UPI00224ED7E4|nr:ankyrin repeat domain-containing protein [Kitasatospora sp. NBC_01287]MCX4744879.1 ankyrin repeat domain-containing protein [Kitasatospora sp. NBC_01287]
MADSSESLPPTAEEPDEAELIELAGRIFDAARAGDAESLRGFLAAGAPANLANDRGDTLLMLAAYHGQAEAVRVLLAGGADPNQANDRGQTPLAGTVFKGADEALDALLAGGADPHAGAPSAFETAQMFGKDELLARFGGR